MSLQQWLANSWLQEHQSSKQEMRELLSICDRDLLESQAQGLGNDWRFCIAYSGALHAATAALHASGFRVARGQSHHLRALQSLQFTIGLDSPNLALLDAFRLKRHAGVYERAGAITFAEADQMFSLAKELREDVAKWLDSEHPELAP